MSQNVNSLNIYRDEILAPIIRLYAGAIGDDFILMDDNARLHRARIVNEYLQQEIIERQTEDGNYGGVLLIEVAQ
jgi:hypothetical protein